LTARDAVSIVDGERRDPGGEIDMGEYYALETRLRFERFLATLPAWRRWLMSWPALWAEFKRTGRNA
jgi:hypothetical protein